MLLDRIVEIATMQRHMEDTVAHIERQREIVRKASGDNEHATSAQIVLDSLVISHSLLEQDLQRVRQAIGLGEAPAHGSSTHRDENIA